MMKDIRNVVPGSLLPLAGAIFLGWDGWEIILFFYIETIIIGLIHAVKLAISQPGSQENIAGQKQPMSPVFATLLFTANYGLFTAIQLYMFWDSIVFPPISGPEGSIFWLSVMGLFIARVTEFTVGFLLPKKYLTTDVGVLFIEPYPRIFVQQGFAILGSLVISLSGADSLAALIAFVVIKIACELYIATFWDAFLENRNRKKRE